MRNAVKPPISTVTLGLQKKSSSCADHWDYTVQSVPKIYIVRYKYNFSGQTPIANKPLFVSGTRQIQLSQFWIFCNFFGYFVHQSYITIFRKEPYKNLNAKFEIRLRFFIWNLHFAFEIGLRITILSQLKKWVRRS